MAEIIEDKTQETEPDNNQNTNQNSEPDGKEKEKEGQAPSAKYTDEDVDKLINRKFAEWQKKQDKAVSEAQKLATMNEQEKVDYKSSQLQKQLDELLAEKTKNELCATARKMLSDQEITVSDDLLTLLVGKDADTTKAAVDSFSELFKSEVKKAVTDALKGGSPKAGSSSGSVTKEDILKVKDRAERQKLINEHMDLFR